MPRFYAVTEDRSLANQVAYAEPVKPQYEQSGPKCPKCGGFIANQRWVPPYDIWLKRASSIADVVPTFGGPELLVSASLARAVSGLKGVERIDEVRVVKVGTKKSLSLPPPLFSVWITHSHVRVDFATSGTVWSSEPEPTHCRYCGPGGGGAGGCFWSFERLVLDLSEWDGEELFYPINLAGTVIASEDALRKAHLADFRNVLVTPVEKYRYSYASWKTA